MCFLFRWWIQLYKLSYLWYSLLGFLITIVVGLLVSILTGSLDTCCLDEDLMSPPIRRWLLSLSSDTKQMLRLSEEVTYCVRFLCTYFVSSVLASFTNGNLCAYHQHHSHVVCLATGL
jgi:hypothetical protein